MYLNTLFFISLLVFLVSGLEQQSCNDLPSSFHTYKEALERISAASFAQKDYANTNSSSFITSANFYSCDHYTGYLIIGINNKLYVHKGVPATIWFLFKNARSMGAFYTQNIRNRYKLPSTTE